MLGLSTLIKQKKITTKSKSAKYFNCIQKAVTSARLSWKLGFKKNQTYTSISILLNKSKFFKYSPFRRS